MNRRIGWHSSTDDELLALRFSDLPITIERSSLHARVARISRELKRVGIVYRPHTWLSTEFFSPDGVPGVAIPFYLAHPRLVRLERSQLLVAEGASERDCLRLLRHETGHAVDTAYALHRRPEWRAAFGRRSAPYRREFRVDPASRDFVHYLPHWYAQSHPAEDFAETFAVWLDPGSRWRSAYPDGAARRKLEVVDSMMSTIGHARAELRSREKTDAVDRLDEALAEHYARKRRRLTRERGGTQRERLSAAFVAARPMTIRSSAAAFIRAQRHAIAVRVTGSFRGAEYSIGEALDSLVLSCRELGLQLHPTKRPPTLTRLAGIVRSTLEEVQQGQHRLFR